MTKCVETNIDDQGLATLTWDMPDRSMNVLNESSMTDFSDALENVVADPDVKGIIITSGKEAFIAGADLETVEKMAEEPGPAEELHAKTGALQTLLRRMETCGKPVVAAINGTAMGGGLEITLACHRRIVADDQRIQLSLPEAKLGLLPGGGGTQRLPRMIGVQAALPILLEGKSMKPQKALQQGVVDAVVPAGDLMQSAKQWLLEEGVSKQPWDQYGFTVPNGGMDQFDIQRTFMAATAMYQAKTFGNYPAGLAILSCVSEGLRLPFEQGLEVETRYFVSLLLDPVARHMIRTLFLSMQSINKMMRRPKDIPDHEVKKLGVLGAGLMGAGVAYVSAKAGIHVVLLDRDQETAEKGRAYAEGVESKAISRKRSTEEKKAAILNRIQPTTSYDELKDCDLIVEAVFEDRDVKANVTKQAAAVIGGETVFGSNTSTLPITGLAEAITNQERFIGIHYFSPVEKMPLVEIIQGEKTSPETLAVTMDYVRQIGKTPIVVKDSRGFYTSRVFGTYVTEGMAMLSEGISPALIENAGKMTGMPMPPLGLADEVGIGLMYQVGKQTKADLGDAFQENPSSTVLELFVEKLERTGKRGKAGFYDYPDGGDKRLWSGLSEHYEPLERQPNVEELKKRFLYVQAVEAARCMEEGLLESPNEADLGAILGWGFSPWTGGPLSYIESIGLSTFVEEAERLSFEYGERFSPPNILKDMATSGDVFYQPKD